MFKKILVPIAFSRYTPGIISFAAKLATPLGAELMIVNVINERDLEAVERIASFGYKVDSEHYVKTLQKERVEKLNEILEELGVDEDKYSFTFLAGDPTTELLKVVVNQSIDLVVMGTKAKDIRHIFTGSVAERMFRKCPVSVISYRGDDVAEALTKRIKKEMAKK